MYLTIFFTCVAIKIGIVYIVSQFYYEEGILAFLVNIEKHLIFHLSWNTVLDVEQCQLHSAIKKPHTLKQCLN